MRRTMFRRFLLLLFATGISFFISATAFTSGNLQAIEALTIEEAIEITDKNIIFIEDGDKIRFLDFNSVIVPQLTKCSSCEFSYTCERKSEESEKYGCVIEREEILALIDELKKEGIDLQNSDKLLVYPLIQNFLRMNRL